MSRAKLKVLLDAAPVNQKILFDKDTISALGDLTDPDILRAVEQLSQQEQEELFHLAEAALKSSRNGDGFIRQIQKLVGTIYHRNIRKNSLEEIQRTGVPMLFKSDLSGFNHANLEAEYHLYTNTRRQNAIAKNEPYEHHNALQFALNSKARSSTSTLETLLSGPDGTNYKQMLRQFRDEKRYHSIPTESLEHFDEMWSKGYGISDYGSMANKNSGHGFYFEVDHMFEKRFLNPPNVVTTYDENSIWAILVPKNERIAELMQKKVPNNIPRIKYIHKEKTRLMRQLIPHGDEHLYSVQYIWDAHMYTFEKLGLEMTPNMRGNLKENFKIYIDGLRKSGETVTYPNFYRKVNAAQFEPI